MLGVVLLAQLAIATNGPDTGTACMPIQLSAALRVPGRAVVRIDPPQGPSMQLLRSSVSARVEPDGSGQWSTIAEASAEVATGLTGRVVLPSFVATVDGRSVASAPFVVNVRAPISPSPVVLVRAQLDDPPGGRTPDSLIVGQQVNYVVDVLLNESARNRLRRNPTFFPPEMASVLAYDVSIPAGVPRHGRRCFETLSYRRALFPLFRGRVEIPPAVLTYSLPLSSSFFSREESFEARTESVVFSAVEPPAQDRPSEYAGAVGSLRISSRVSAPTVRLGDPVVLTVRVEGIGNVKLLPRPVFAVPWAMLTMSEERVRVDSARARISGSKEYDWIITPRTTGARTIPGIRYPFYDPDTRRYAVIETAPISVNVTPGSLAPSDTVVAARLPLRIVLRPERSEPFSSRPSYWLLLALAPIPASMRRAFRRGRWRARDESAVKRLRTLAGSRSAPPPRELRRLFLDAIRERVPTVAHARDPLARVLRRAGVSDDAALEAETLLARLDDAAFSGSGALDDRALREAAELVDMIDREALPNVAARRALGGAGVLLVIVGLVATAAPEAAERSFAEGVSAYRRGQFSIAERRFARAASAAPRAVDAWVNLGVAAWEAADTAQAARAWHHALRLDPLESETRERLRSIQALGPRSAAYVAPISIDLLAGIVLALWMAGWLVLALPEPWRPGAARGFAGGGIALALIGVVGLFELRERLEARDLAVLLHGRALLDAPAADAAVLAPLGAGEAGRLGAREGGWVHIAFDGARAGWVPSGEVVPIDPVRTARLTGSTPVR
ncbi:MAG: BatD family protein [Gemmatimonadaceae bacterium]